MVTDTDTIVNRYAVLGQDARRGDLTLTLSATAGLGTTALAPLGVGDLLLIVQAQGADIQTARDIIGFGTVTDLGTAGLFEFVSVKHVDDVAGTIDIYGNCGGLRNNYSAAAHVQIIRVPQLASLHVQAAGSIVAPPWNGATGGVVALSVRDGAQLDGLIDASARGFRGGQRHSTAAVRQPGVGTFYASLSPDDGGAKGEGIAGAASEYLQIGSYGRGAAANGGGGGNRLVAGGGGGGNGGVLTAWNGQGVMPQGAVGGALAWALDPGYDGTRTTFSGGGRGGYTASSALLDPTLVAPGDVTWLQDFRRERGGLGGRPVQNDPQSHLYLGGGGGAGDDFQSQSGRGGQGGGLIFLVAAQVSGSGRIVANGEDGGTALATSAGAGGGGAGGTVVLGASAVTGVAVEARGGNGGSQALMRGQAAGPGGGGGGGYIAVPAGTAVGLLVDGGLGGTTASTDMVKFPRNGATDGAPGQSTGVTSGDFATSQFCGGADLSIELVPTPAQAQARDPVSLQITVQNHGPSPASDVQILVQVPAGTTLQQSQPGPWDCTISDVTLTCKRSLMTATETSSVVVTLTPPLNATAIPLTAQVSAGPPDLDTSNNTATLAFTNATPIIEKLDGGGFSCTLTAGPAAADQKTGTGLALVLGALLAALVRCRARFRTSVYPLFCEESR